jgi:hypothetical protein
VRECAAGAELLVSPDAPLWIEYGPVEGELLIKAEIAARGPVACGIDATQIEQYTGGVAPYHMGHVDHVISLAGWGVTGEGEEYWLGRNSWGTYWGERGYGLINVCLGRTRFPCFCTCSTQRHRILTGVSTRALLALYS